MDYQLHHRILVWIEMAAENLRHSLSKELQVEKKASARDLITEMDRAIDQAPAFATIKVQYSNQPN